MKRILLLAALVAVASSAFAGVAAASTPLGRIVIPRLALDAVFFNGQAAADTARGPSHYPWTGMPGQRRTVAIAGHRVTHTRPFRHLERLRRGDLIRVQYGSGPSFPKQACYRVSGASVVRPSNVGVTRDVGYDRLVLTTCTPPHSATYRLVVTARRAPTCG